MNIPVGPFIAMGKFGYNLYSFLFKGPKVSAALDWIHGEQKNLGASHLNPKDGEAIHFTDAIFVFEFKSHYELVLKNTSRHTAYNIQLLNKREIFSSCEEPEKLASLLPNESLRLKCWFIHRADLKGSETADRHHIPPHLQGRKLFIVYQNEAQKDFFTQFNVDDKKTENVYLLKRPVNK
jgi:hypothetical protein